MTHAAVSHETPYGRAEVRWAIAAGTLTVDAVVPPGTTATVALPGEDAIEVASGHHRFLTSIEETRP
jgi:alpha-L-rhamnosidase